MKLDSKTASFYESRPSKWLAGRKAVVPCAHILGGGSSVRPFFCLLAKICNC
jgi:alcohol oxidase